MSDVLVAQDGAMRAGGARWAYLLIAWAAFLMSFADRLAWANVNMAVSQSLAMSVGQLGIFVTAFYVGYVVSNIGAGFAGDWLGPRLTLAISLASLGVCTFLFGSITSVAAGLALQVLMGLTAGADYVAGVKLIAVWFGKLERGRAMGLFMTATSLAVVLTNLLVPRLLVQVGWSGAYELLGGVTTGLGVVAYLVVRDGPSTATHVRPDFAALWHNRDLRWLGLAGFGALWGTWGFAFWAGALMVRGHGLTAVQSGFVVALFGAAAIVAKPLIGWLSDLLGGRRKALVIGCLLFFAVMMGVFSQLSTLLAFEMAGPFLGIGAFAYSPLMNTMVAEASGRNLASSGAGVTNAFWGLGNVIVPSLLGLVFARTGSFELACATLSAGPLFGAVCMMFVSERRTV
jgi:ACS family glucarate transporter-like MFS transporter